MVGKRQQQEDVTRKEKKFSPEQGFLWRNRDKELPIRRRERATLGVGNQERREKW